MKMASAPNNNSSLDQRFMHCLILMIKEQNSQKEMLGRLVSELACMREDVFRELQRVHESVDSIDRKLTSGRNRISGADTAVHTKPIGGARKKITRKQPKRSPENSDDDTNPNVNTGKPVKHADKEGNHNSRRHQPNSPVLIKPDPPRHVRKPVPRSGREVGKTSYNMNKAPLPNKALIKAQPHESDFIGLMKTLCLEVNRTTIAAITSVATHMSGTSLASRPPALNTILIIDTSDSMMGQPFDTAKIFVNKMIDDIDTSAGEFGLEEYIAVITCGETVNIMQPFTNDFLQIRNTIDGLQVGGRTPLMTSLVLALCYLELQSECVRMNDHVIMPRLVVVSDFDATLDTHPFSGRDVNGSRDRITVQRELFKLGLTFKSQGYTVACVPVGESNAPVAQEFAAKCTGDVVETKFVHNIGSYYRYQMLIGRALADCDAGLKRNQEMDVYSIVQNSMKDAGLGIIHKKGLMSLLEKVLNKVDDIDSDEEFLNAGSNYPGESPNSHIRLDESGEDPPDLPDWVPSRNIESLGFEEQSGLPSIGSRIKRGKDWKWENQDSGNPGTIVGHKQKGIAYILWDNGSIGAYRYGYEGQYDIQKTKEPRHVKPGEIEVGCCVIRGSDWERGDEDGGHGTIGVVVRKLRDRYVMVRWPSRVIETYCFGARNKWELEITLGTPQSSGQNSPLHMTEPGVAGSQFPTPGAKPENGEDLRPWWSLRDTQDQWRPFSEASVEKIEVKYNTSNLLQQCLVEYQNKPVKVFMEENQCEIGGKRYQIKRELLTAAEINDKKMLETYFGPL